MNVTVHVPGPLRQAVEGKRRVDLGLPAAADAGDVVQALIALYPKLKQHVAHERSGRNLQMRLLVEQKTGESPFRLMDGQRVYLVADQPRRLTDPVEDEL